MSDKWDAKRQLKESVGILAFLHLWVNRKLPIRKIPLIHTPEKRPCYIRSIYDRGATSLTSLIKTKKAFKEKVAKKQPDLLAETVFDEKHRPKIVLGATTPK